MDTKHPNPEEPERSTNNPKPSTSTSVKEEKTSVQRLEEPRACTETSDPGSPKLPDQRHRRSVRRRSDDEEERSPDYLIPRTRRRLPHPNAAGKPTPHTGIGTEGEEADEPKAAVFNATGGHAAQEDSAHQQPKDRRKQNAPPWIEPRHLHPQTNEGSDIHSTGNPSYLALTT